MFFKIFFFKSVMRFRFKGKLVFRFVGFFEIIERIGQLVYRLRLSEELVAMYDVFYVFMLRKYESDSFYVLRTDEVELDSVLNYVEYSVQILDRKEKQLRNKIISLVMV